MGYSQINENNFKTAASILFINSILFPQVNVELGSENEADNTRDDLVAYLQYLHKNKQQETITKFSSLVQKIKLSDTIDFVDEFMGLIDFLLEILIKRFQV